MVLLEHRTRPGESHFDWMLQQESTPPEPTGDERTLTTFRVGERIDLLDEGAKFEAVRIHDHRLLYLTYEGELSGGRGRVLRVASGHCRILEDGAGLFAAEVDFGRGPLLVEGEPAAVSASLGEGAGWRFVVRPGTPSR
ncbi:MAG: hypothetical protein EA423_02920 [Phycisphaerales bacterium]|nr:MAG: hypothetical protein EA423_02920 [Phycisphaerales bacterium]